MTGTWIGTYQHKSKYTPAEIRNQPIGFTLEILDFDGINFSGTVEDHAGTGGTRGIGKIEGKIKNSNVWFIKIMPIRTILLGNKVIEENKPHRKIYYSGTYKQNSVQGTWKFKAGFGRVNQKIVFFPPVKGTWEMEKREDT